MELHMNPEQFEKTLNKVLNQNRAISDEKHKLDHDYVGIMRARDKRREAMWIKFKMSLVGGIALLLLSGLVWVGKVVLEIINKNGTG